ncbi:MAG TPA: SRPBCC family protein [Saprospiraceae bacterium]|nr:SRPBCC family protein [Saprospiraceae bacterium]HPG07756.1 SRPBCC family protein [Saprospiraceae bacterium]HQU53953.1 SRPBCC family protein [Saprospiraceae bacterium]HRV87185.1 SRPBCC family protein [Saprospiraceae bacterium]
MIILYLVLALIALLLLTAAILPKTSTLTVSTVIDRPVREVFEYVKHLKNQKYYSVWVMADPDVKLSYTGEDGTVGFISAWSSDNKNVGVGAQEITNIVDGQRYDVELRFEKPFKATNQAYTTTEALGNDQTRVTNVFTAHSAFPMNLMSVLMKNMLLRDMNQNMANLKKELEV